MEEQSRELASGEEVYVVKRPGGKWAIESYEWEQVVTAGRMQFVIATQDASKLGWQDLRFNSPDEAAAFVAAKIKEGKAPGKHTTKVPA